MNPGQVYLTAPFPKGNRCWEHYGGSTSRKQQELILCSVGDLRDFYKGHASFEGTAEGKQIWGMYGLATHCWCACMIEVHVGQGIRTYLTHRGKSFLLPPGGNLFSSPIRMHKL